MQPLEKLLRKLKREGRSVPPWMMPLGHEVIVYGGMEYAYKAFIEELSKDAGEDGDEEENEDAGESTGSEDEDESGNAADTGKDNANNTTDFNAKHHAGQPVRRTGREASFRRRMEGLLLPYPILQVSPLTIYVVPLPMV